MAILESRTKTGISWISESIAIFKQSPRKWLLLALVYLGLFVLLPATPGAQILAFATVLIWPTFIAFAMRLYRNAEFKKEEKLSTVMQLIQPKMRALLTLGALNLVYFILISFFLIADMQTMAGIVDNQEQMNPQELSTAMQTLIPIFFKLTLLFIPLMIINWFSPTLITFNQYPLGKAIKSSIAGCLQYIVALIAAWLLLSASMLALLTIASFLLGMFAVVSPAIVAPLLNVVVFGCVLLGIALTLAFQYVSYRDVFRAA